MSLNTPPAPPGTLVFPEHLASHFAPYLPPDVSPEIGKPRPFVTLTYAQSLDSHLSLGPGIHSYLSGPASEAMAHFLRGSHDAILIGVGTAVVDDPGLNCRLVGGTSPRPVVLDPNARWDVGAESKVVRLAREGKGQAPWVLHTAGSQVEEGRRAAVESVGGRYVPVPAGDGPRLQWPAVFEVLKGLGVASLMIEGGGRVINELLELSNRGGDLVDSVIVTVAPVYLGAGGIEVAPARIREDVQGPRLAGVRWVQMGEDAVLCGRIQR